MTPRQSSLLPLRVGGILRARNSVSCTLALFPCDETRTDCNYRHNLQEEMVARKTVLVCDKCGTEVDEGKGAILRVTFNDARRGAKQADLCDSCAGGMPGAAVARRGRKPKSIQ